mmetsp:Transcript_1234/g.3666  ORF Transcript_1234/g.3666 Transcript_1234/m.3666 type:complete len:105 (-) Transcript_1234:1568-1882(-)|eukprot:CAMPEP_0206150818 /NCGR_PEP_ID=MMETSP1473-20131121/38499_1 /ASSEMBLY_ACC=CAM_ASM_001109 /TAXON_ID=1461547 /ORGANISM="Stichococcus sp, Strain RCC1054" /LENGTH=104 /DNA_ID=CAMNT_0053548345 /DNA_START=120 /DNA_END=434 /DNA_ORIENTATION=-
MPNQANLSQEREDRREQCTALAVREALKNGAFALAASGAGVFGANTFSPAFRNALGTSGKAALVVTPAFFTFFYVSQTTMNNCVRTTHWSDETAAAEAAMARDK